MSILLKGIKNGTGAYTGIGELGPDEIAELTGNLKFADGTEQTTAYDPTAVVGGVSSVFTRTGDVIAVAGDYTAAQVTLNPDSISGVDATDVQGGFEELGQLITALQGGLEFKGLLGFNDPDPAPPPATGASYYYIFNTEGTRSVGDATGATVLIGDWLAYSRTTSEWVHLDYSARTANALGTTYDPGPSARNVILTGDNVQSALDQAEAALLLTDSRLIALETATPPDAGVVSFNTRTGAVMPAAGDYTATQTTFTPVGAITATNVQAAIAYVEANSLAQADLDAHVNQVAGAHAATAISFAPTTEIAATEVQAAIAELSLKAIPFFDTTGALKPISLI